MKVIRRIFSLIVGFNFLFLNLAIAHELDTGLRQRIEIYLTDRVRGVVFVQPVKIDSSSVTKKTLRLYANANLSYMTFDRTLVDAMYNELKDITYESFPKHKIELYSDGYRIEEYIGSERKARYRNRVGKPLVTGVSKAYTPGKGLLNRHLAVWQSHGWHYDQKLMRWEWQRARLFQTVEDLYTQSYILPFVVPMLENAGANVLLPRERDYNRFEVVVDNDGNSGQSTYIEKNGVAKWESGVTQGFAHKSEVYIDKQNPFKEGTFRRISTIKKSREVSLCEWIPDIPERGAYAVYVSYQTVDNSTDDALYKVSHLGGETEFRVNQQMGGGTWIYLGHFSFEKGRKEEYKVSLSNHSATSRRVVTADAVKIGGGMGNIARCPNESGEITANIKSSDSIEDTVFRIPEMICSPESSGRPRYTEGARYWLQWAGVPDSVYSSTNGKNDYIDDYSSRGLWVNYLAGGSEVLPKRKGLNIPLDLAMAFHTDAGTTLNDSVVGTLGICMTHENNETFENGKARIMSRDLTAAVVNEIVNDIRAKHEPEWTRRHIWNRSYSEARIPQVPSMLLELLSHQNLADMRYGLDPRFRFTVSRAIYKAILKYTAYQYKVGYVVQPLPVHSFCAVFEHDNRVRLKWHPDVDELEPTADAKKYIVYTRIGDTDFDNGRVVDDTEVVLDIENDKIYSFRITAVNDGGESFPSETLSVGRCSNEKGVILVVNGFTRLSAPFSFETVDGVAGFADSKDHGVPYINEYNYTGSQHEFRRQVPWSDDDAPGFGASNADFETKVLAGNNFDYPAVHGRSILKCGYSFVSSSYKSVENNDVDLKIYRLIDIILGKQKQTIMGRGAFGVDFKTFTSRMQEKIKDYTQSGGNILVSGAYIGSDLCDTESPLYEDRYFAENILGYTWRTGQASVKGEVHACPSPFPSFSGTYNYHARLNSDSYAVESPDAIEPSGNNSFTIFRYSDNNLSAGIASVFPNYKTCILGFPLEVIKSESERNRMMQAVLSFVLN